MENQELDIEFSYNWNNKLSSKCFTTFRIENKKYKVGAIANIKLKRPKSKEYQVLKKAEILDKKVTKLEHVNEWIARLDTGYSLEEFKKVIGNMYGKDKEGKPQDITKIDFCLLLLKTIESV